MKISYILKFFFIFLGLNLYAQQNPIRTNTNQARLAQIAELEKAKWKLQKQLALSKAKLMNWQVKIHTADGSYAELVRLDANGNPVYYKTYNRGAGITVRANQLYSGGSLGLQIEGQNMIIGEWDGGGVLGSHEALNGRVTQMDNVYGTSNHSTHVAGTMIAGDQVANGNARGMAFQASLHAYDWNDDSAEVATAAGNGLLISNHSYGYAWPAQYQYGKYDIEAVTFDDIMYNAPYYLMVCAAGNDRDTGANSGDNGYDLLSGHACAKNAMVVAAVEEVPNYTGPSSVVMSTFSSWGPTDDGRIKPDISAKGVDVYSSIDSANNAYDTYSGTSMASPSVAGSLLLLQQYYNQKNGNFMRAATLRGLAIHSADEAGNHPGPDYEYGWGLLNVEKAAEIIRDDGLTSLISEETLTDGNTYTITVDALGTEPLMASICWTDPAGDEVTDTTEDLYVKSLVNDLDIRITHNGNTYYPWKLNINNMSAAATQGDNDVDNIEKIQIDNPSGSYTISVTHKGTLTADQDFTLILSGIAFNDFYITSVNSDTQVLCTPADNTVYDLHLTTISGFNGSVDFSTLGLPATVNADFTPPSLSASGDFQLNLSNLSGLSPGNYPFTIRGTSNTDVVDFNALLRILDNNFPVQNLTEPQDNANSIEIDPVLIWEVNSNAEEYQLQVSDDANFNNILTDIITANTSYQLNNLNYNTTYYWRVKPKNSCGEGIFSASYTFTTVCQAPQNITAGNLLLDSVDLSWSDPNNATQWEIEIVEVNTTPTGSGIIVNSNPYTFTGLNSSTTYQAYIRSVCGTSHSAWGVSGEFTTASDYCNGDHFYDSGGPSGYYSNNEDITTTIAPSSGFNSVSVTFNSFQLESGYDYLYIYDGSDTNATLIGEYTGTNNPGTIVANNPSGCLTFRFISDYSVTREGWDATVTCINISCPNPSNINFSNILSDSVEINWTNGGNETQWQIEYGPSGFTLGTGTNLIVNTNPYTLTGLNPNTDYDLYLRANCGANPGDDDSSWIGPANFTTACSITTAPFFDDVESHAGTTSADISDCWSTIPSNTTLAFRWNISETGYTPTSYTGPDTANSGTHFYYTESTQGNTGDVAELISPQIDISALSIPYLSFYYYMYGSDIGDLHVDVLNNNTWTNDLLIYSGQQQSSGSESWLLAGVPLDNFSGIIQIRFRAVRANGHRGDIAIDDIRVEETPSCPQPGSLTVINTDATTAELSWTNGGNETQWQIEYGPAGFTQGSGTLLSINSNPYTLTGLTPNTGYDAYLRAICGANPGDDDSYWIGPVSFTTQPDYCNGDHFYDSGGPYDNYGNNENTITTISPSPGYSLVSVSFISFSLESGYDYLYIYDGDDINAPLIGEYTGTNNPGTIDATNPSGSLTFQFISDYSVTSPGWDATVSCFNNTCPAPSNIQFSNITTDSVEISWTNGGNETQWEIEYGITGFTQGTGTLIQVNTNPYNLTGLNQGTDYDIYLRANCGSNPGDDDSNWVGPAGFSTICNFTAPYLEDVENHPSTELSLIGNCWTSIPYNNSSNYRWNVANYQTPTAGTGPANAHSGIHYFYTEASDPATTGEVAELISSPIDISSLSQPELTFYYFMYGIDTGDLYIDLFYNNSWHNNLLHYSGQQQNSETDDWLKATLDLSNTGGSITIRFRSIRGNGFAGDIAIDDISVAEKVQGIEYLSNQYNFNYYPNPAENNLYLSSDEEIESVSIQNLLGQEVMGIKPGKSRENIDIGKLPAGTYILKIVINQQAEYYKFIKN